MLDSGGLAPESGAANCAQLLHGTCAHQHAESVSMPEDKGEKSEMSSLS